MDDIAITELEKIDATRVDGVGMPANGIPILLMKSTAPVEKDWAQWDAAHGGGGKATAAGDSKASAASAVARAKQTIADHKAGKKVSAADLKNAHDVHEAHLAHEAKLAAEAKAKGAAKPAAKKSTDDEVAKGERDCPKCDKSYDADHTGSKCENCGTDLPDAPAAKSELEETRELVKAIVGRKVDETPDIAGGTAVIAQIADLIIAEAQELKSGQAGEIGDIMQLAMAAEMIWSWRTGEESVASGSVMPATALMQSAADVAKDRNYSAAERKEMAGDGRALPDGSYPINDEHDLNSAAILARSGHGDATAAAKHIGKRAKELGVANPLDNSDDTAKSEIAKDEAVVDTVTQETGSLNKAVEEAVAKAMAPLQERITTLNAELAKVKATPVPGGPVMSVARPSVAAADDHAVKALRYEQQADILADPREADLYRQLAAQERAKITS